MIKLCWPWEALMLSYLKKRLKHIAKHIGVYLFTLNLALSTVCSCKNGAGKQCANMVVKTIILKTDCKNVRFPHTENVKPWSGCGTAMCCSEIEWELIDSVCNRIPAVKIYMTLMCCSQMEFFKYNFLQEFKMV